MGDNMNTSHCFGGTWTQDKLNMVAKYLREYMKIFKANERAMYFSTYYVDAFAGNGHRKDPDQSQDQCLFGDLDAVEFQKGSTIIALETKPAFDHYIFIDKNPDYIEELNFIRDRYTNMDIEVKQDDSNRYLKNWCECMDWRKNRAVVFLDPYGAQVEWETIESIAHTKAIDLWLLFPLGQAVNRMLTKRVPDPTWCRRLDCLFGTNEWIDVFYAPPQQKGIFGDDEHLEKTANFDSIGRYFVRQLETVFSGVSKRPRALYNSKNVPIFLLCFASGNPRGSKTAIKIADYILGN
jgi:three-Cys-motif partner protein